MRELFTICDICKKQIKKGENYFIISIRKKGEYNKGLSSTISCVDCQKIEKNFVGCGVERPLRKTLCQLAKGHIGSHQAVIYWEDK